MHAPAGRPGGRSSSRGRAGRPERGPLIRAKARWPRLRRAAGLHAAAGSQATKVAGGRCSLRRSCPPRPAGPRPDPLAVTLASPGHAVADRGPVAASMGSRRGHPGSSRRNGQRARRHGPRRRGGCDGAHLRARRQRSTVPGQAGLPAPAEPPGTPAQFTVARTEPPACQASPSRLPSRAAGWPSAGRSGSGRPHSRFISRTAPRRTTPMANSTPIWPGAGRTASRPMT